MAKPKKPKEPIKPKTRADYDYVRRSKMAGNKADGTRKRIYGLGKTGREAQAKLDEAVRLYEQSLKGADLTVSEWSERWKKSYKTNVSDHQKNHYIAKLKLDILPVIGDKRMKDITLEDLQSLMNSYKDGRKGTVDKIYQAICLLFVDAVDEDIIERNPATRLEKPAVVEETRRPLELEERKTLIKVAKIHKHGAFVLTLLYSGMRRGECLALLRSDVDLEKKRISITKAISFKKGNKPVLGDTKSNEMRKVKLKKTTLSPEEAALGHRVVPIPDLLLPVLTKVCANKEPGDVLFPKTNGGYATQTAFNCWWNSIMRNCHITAGAKLYRNAVQLKTSPIDNKLSAHFLRYTYAQDMLTAQVDSYTRIALMGHSTKNVTDHYTKLSDEARDTALEQINTYLNKKDSCAKSETNKNDKES